ncbi:MAG: YigZ family protein [Clostridiales bacterium]|nr:YigZ family protein [Clostridiales bacterium]
MINEYRTVYQEAYDEIIIEKSRFIGYVKPITSEEEAIEFIEKIKTKHKDATHNVPAYVIGKNNEIQRYSDDGEPTGTAGIPVLEVIKKENLNNVAIVVTRYFGGIKLGVGGLVRAYTKGARIALDAGKIITKILYKEVIVKVDYTLLGKLQNDILQAGYILKGIEYHEIVEFSVYVKIDDVEKFRSHIIEWTNARCEIIEKENIYLTELDGKIIYD